MKARLLMLALAALGGCAVFDTEPATPGPWTRWVCDSQAEVLWRFADLEQGRVQVRLGGSERVYQLRAEPGASGALYSDGVLALHVQGSEGLAYWVATNDLIGRGCKAP